ncbi:hypothetical protein AB0M95_21365 [Sphaerisporangium sp. NPDC051017]|uniref:hypothetical protein n=1 Tax=unclassified Sphaerisporangium TaxID=2630420 RepID=UPI003406F735
MTKPTILEDLQAAFPRWTIWRSSAGRLWATRNQRLTDAQMELGLSHTIDGDDAPQLVERLRGEENAGASGDQGGPTT